MKRLLILACLLGSAFTYAPPSGRVTLSWSYTDPTVQSFNLYGSTNLAAPITNWTCLTNVPGWTTNGAVSWITTNLTIQIQPGQMFFFMTASNSFWESVPSNIISTPAMPSMPTNPTLTRTN
jgi:hypothetical protein